MRRAAESALLAREKQFFNPAPFLPTQQINKEVGLRTILFQTLLPLSFLCWQTSASKIKPTGPNIAPYYGSFFSFSPGVLMCARVAQHPDGNNINLVNVRLYMWGEVLSVTAAWIFHVYAGTAIIILRSDSGGQLEITGPVCFAWQTSFDLQTPWYILKGPTFSRSRFCFRFAWKDVIVLIVSSATAPLLWLVSSHGPKQARAKAGTAHRRLCWEYMLTKSWGPWGHRLWWDVCILSVDRTF